MPSLMSSCTRIPARKMMICGSILGMLYGSQLFAEHQGQPPVQEINIDQTAMLKYCIKEPITATENEYIYKDKKFKISSLKSALSGQLVGYIFESAQFAPEVQGYGGPFNLLVIVNEAGVLLDFAVKANEETPKFLKKVMTHKKELLGKNIFSGATGFNGDAVTGATYTSKGLTNVLNISGRLCAAALQKGTAKESDRKTIAAPPGKVRDIDTKAYKERIENKQLSAQAAQYWQAAE